MLTHFTGIYLTAVMMITSVSVIMTVIVINIHYRGPSDRFLPYRFRRFLLIHVMGVQANDPSVNSTCTDSPAYCTSSFNHHDNRDDHHHRHHADTVDDGATRPASSRTTVTCTTPFPLTDIDLASNFKQIDDRLKRQTSYTHNQSTSIEVCDAVCDERLLLTVIYSLCVRVSLPLSLCSGGGS